MSLRCGFGKETHPRFCMARASLTHNILGFLRKFKIAYVPLRRVKRFGKQAGVFITRRIFPKKSLLGPPKGWFSALRLVQEGRIPGEIILPGQEVPEFGPETLVRICKLGQDKQQPWPVFWSLHHQARLIGGSLVHVDHEKRACIEAMYGMNCFRDDPAYNDVVHGRPVPLPGNWTSVACRWNHVRHGSGYWHFLMDAIPRLALLPRFPADTQIIVPSNFGKWQEDLLDLLGLAGRYHRSPGMHLRVEHYHYSSQTSMTGCYNRYAVEFLRNSYLAKADASYRGPRKFYITRNNWSRGVVNDEEVRNFFTARGWSLVAPETLAITEQIALFSRAEAVCGLHGSALANIVWTTPGCAVVELCPLNYLAGAFECVAKIAGLRHAFLICEADSHFRARVDLESLARKLDGLGL